MNYVSLGQLCIEARPGFACGTSDENGVVQVRMNNVSTEGRLNFEAVRRVPSSAVDMARFQVQTGDILFNSTNSPELVGKSALFSTHDEPVVYSNHFLRLRVDRSKSEPAYISRWLQAVRSDGVFTGMCKQWVNQAAVASERLMALSVPLPTLAEQRRIAAILDQADALRAKRRQVLSELADIAQAIFLEMFDDPGTNKRSWPTYQCADLCHRISVGVVVRPASYYQKAGVPAIRGTNIKPNGIDLSDLVYFSKMDSNGPLSKSRLRSGDLVIVRTGQPGLAAVVPDELEGANAIDVIIVTPDSTRIHPVYMRELLNSKNGRQIVLAQSRGQIQQHFNVGSLAAAQLIVPPIKLQETFAGRVAASLRLFELERSSSTGLDTLFASLQHRAFRGEL